MLKGVCDMPGASVLAAAFSMEIGLEVQRPLATVVPVFHQYKVPH